MSEEKKTSFVPSHGSRRERGSDGLSGGAKRAVPAEAALTELMKRWHSLMLEARAAGEHNFSNGNYVAAGLDKGISVGLALVLSDLTYKEPSRAAGGNNDSTA